MPSWLVSLIAQVLSSLPIKVWEAIRDQVERPQLVQVDEDGKEDPFAGLENGSLPSEAETETCAYK